MTRTTASHPNTQPVELCSGPVGTHTRAEVYKRERENRMNSDTCWLKTGHVGQGGKGTDPDISNHSECTLCMELRLIIFNLQAFNKIRNSFLATSLK